MQWIEVVKETVEKVILINWIKLQSSGCEPHVCVWDGRTETPGQKKTLLSTSAASHAVCSAAERTSKSAPPVWGRKGKG